jgi:hypothetical protein
MTHLLYKEPLALRGLGEKNEKLPGRPLLLWAPSRWIQNVREDYIRLDVHKETISYGVKDGKRSDSPRMQARSNTTRTGLLDKDSSPTMDSRSVSVIALLHNRH